MAKGKKGRIPATCHPERINWARGFCKACYQRWRRVNIPGAAEAHRREVKRWRKANPAKRRIHFVKSRYGITKEQYEFLLESQEGRCGICRENSGGKPLCVDHDHATMIVRGLLCQRCNLALGLYEKLTSRGDVVAYLARKLPFVARRNRYGSRARANKADRVDG